MRASHSYFPLYAMGILKGTIAIVPLSGLAEFTSDKPSLKEYTARHQNKNLANSLASGIYPISPAKNNKDKVSRKAEAEMESVPLLVRAPAVTICRKYRGLSQGGLTMFLPEQLSTIAALEKKLLRALSIACQSAKGAEPMLAGLSEELVEKILEKIHAKWLPEIKKLLKDNMSPASRPPTTTVKTVWSKILLFVTKKNVQQVREQEKLKPNDRLRELPILFRKMFDGIFAQVYAGCIEQWSVKGPFAKLLNKKETREKCEKKFLQYCREFITPKGLCLTPLQKRALQQAFSGIFQRAIMTSLHTSTAAMLCKPENFTTLIQLYIQCLSRDDTTSKVIVTFLRSGQLEPFVLQSRLLKQPLLAIKASEHSPKTPTFDLLLAIYIDTYLVKLNRFLYSLNKLARVFEEKQRKESHCINTLRVNYKTTWEAFYVLSNKSEIGNIFCIPEAFFEKIKPSADSSERELSKKVQRLTPMVISMAFQMLPFIKYLNVQGPQIFRKHSNEFDKLIADLSTFYMPASKEEDTWYFACISMILATRANAIDTSPMYYRMLVQSSLQLVLLCHYNQSLAQTLLGHFLLQPRIKTSAITRVVEDPLVTTEKKLYALAYVFSLAEGKTLSAQQYKNDLTGTPPSSVPTFLQAETPGNPGLNKRSNSLSLIGGPIFTNRPVFHIGKPTLKFMENVERCAEELVNPKNSSFLCLHR